MEENFLMQIMRKASENKISPARQCLLSKDYRPLLSVREIWPELTPFDSDSTYTDIRSDAIFDEIGHCDFAVFCKMISDSVQFPLNTTCLHGLGVLSSAANFNFRMSYWGSEKPVNLYVITAQPSSSGKSAINDFLSSPVRESIMALNAERQKKVKMINKKLTTAQKQFTDADTDEEMAALTDEIERLEQDLNQNILYTYAVDDATPEALESIAAQQDGIFNIISDESDAVNIMLGNVYKGDGKANHGIYLKAWDGDYHSPARITRKTKPGRVRASMSVIAQDEAIKSILEAGMSGRGISERVLMLHERTMLGRRKHDEYKPIDKHIKSKYKELIDNIINEEGTVLYFSSDAEALITGIKCHYELKLGDGEEMSNRMIRGFVGKADKHIRKLAAVLHIAKEWQCGGERLTEINQDTMFRAVKLFTVLVDVYIESTGQLGFAGAEAEAAAIIDFLQKHKQKKNTFAIRDIYQSRFIRDHKSLKNVTGLSSKIRYEYIPELERRGYLVYDENRDAVILSPQFVYSSI